MMKIGELFQPTRVEEKIGSRWRVTVTPPPIVGISKSTGVSLTEDQYARYCKWRDDGVLIQDALPELTSSQREAILTGLGDDDFDRIARPLEWRVVVRGIGGEVIYVFEHADWQGILKFLEETGPEGVTRALIDKLLD